MGFLISAILYLLIAVIVLYAILEYLAYTKIAYYTKQGLRYKWKPLIVALLFGKNHYEMGKKLTEEAKGEDLALTFIYGGVQICPLTPKALKEFYEKEEEHTTRVMKIIDSTSHLRLDGEPPHKARSIFKKIYIRPNIKNFQPMILECLRNQIQIIKQKVKAEGGSFKLDLHEDFSLPFFDKMATRLGLGDSKEHLSIPELGGESFHAATKENTEQARSCISVLNVLTGGLYAKLGLSKEYNKYLATREEIRKYVYKVIDERLEAIEKGEYTPTKTNIVDFLILENAQLREANKEPHTRDEICQHIQDVYKAGFDTTTLIFESLFSRFVLKENREHLDELKEVIRKDFSDKEYSIDFMLDHPYLHAIFTEASRVFPTLNRSFPKTVIKPFKLCGVKIRKGDDVVVRYFALNHNKEHFPNPGKFDPSRFDNLKKPPRFTFMQFGHGRRSCVGRNFADFMVKTFLVELLTEFNFDYDDDFEPNFSHNDYLSLMKKEKINTRLANK